jgi:hypothetical protein
MLRSLTLTALAGVVFLAPGLPLPKSGALPPPDGVKNKEGPAKVQQLRGGLALFDGKVVYVVNPGGGIDARDVETGQVLWTTEKKLYWPLAVHGRLLVVRERDPQKANLVRLVFLDLDQKGKVVKQCEPVEFPAVWWNDPISHYIGGAPKPTPLVPVFHSENRIENGKLMIAWETGWIMGLAKDATQVKKGLFAVDLESGKVQVLQAEKSFVEPKEIVVGERKFTVIDVTTQSNPNVGINITSTVPKLLATDTKTGKVAWECVLRGGLTKTVNFLAP